MKTIQCPNCSCPLRLAEPGEGYEEFVEGLVTENVPDREDRGDAAIGVLGGAISGAGATVVVMALLGC
jgi:hypothetical protein